MKLFKAYLTLTLIIATAFVGIRLPLIDKVFAGVTNRGANQGGLIAHYSLAQNSLKSSTVISDLTPYNHTGTITAGTGGFTTNQRGVEASAYDFDGADTSIPVPEFSNSALQSGFTISTWIKPDSIGETGGRIIDKTEDTNGLNGFYFIISTVGGGGTGHIRSNISNGIAVNSALSSIVYGVWQHALITITSDGVANIYLNGVLSGTANQNTNPVSQITTANPLTIGNRSSATDRTFDGAISDVRIFNRVLSAEEITALYNGIGNYEIAFSSTASTTTQYLTPIAQYPLSTGSRLSSTVVADTTPYQHNGTITAGASAGFAADQRNIAGMAYDFDGADTSIDTGSDWIGTQAVTVTAWIKADTMGETAGRIISNAKFILGFISANKLSLTSDSFTGNKVMSGTITYGRWYHIAVTRASNGTAQFFINGVSDSAAGASGTPIAGITNIIIGNTSTPIRTWNGKISDLRVYNKVLSSNEISYIYNSSKP